MALCFCTERVNSKYILIGAAVLIQGSHLTLNQIENVLMFRTESSTMYRRIVVSTAHIVFNLVSSSQWMFDFDLDAIPIA